MTKVELPTPCPHRKQAGPRKSYQPPKHKGSYFFGFMAIKGSVAYYTKRFFSTISSLYLLVQWTKVWLKLCLCGWDILNVVNKYWSFALDWGSKSMVLSNVKFVSINRRKMRLGSSLLCWHTCSTISNCRFDSLTSNCFLVCCPPWPKFSIVYFWAVLHLCIFIICFIQFSLNRVLFCCWCVSGSVFLCSVFLYESALTCLLVVRLIIIIFSDVCLRALMSFLICVVFLDYSLKLCL